MGKKFTPTFRFPHSCVTVYVISIELHQVIISLLLKPLATLRLSLGADSGRKRKPLRAKKKKAETKSKERGEEPLGQW